MTPDPEQGLLDALRRDRAVVGAALAVVVVLAWAYVLWLAHDMAGSGSDMPGMDMSVMAPALVSWGAADFVFAFAMWSAMMLGMMLPSAAPMLLIYARVGRQAAARGRPFAATAWFAAGYVAAWTAFAFIASAAQWLLESGLMLMPHWASVSAPLSGLILMAAGLYQWTPMKDACLGQCQTPLGFIARQGGFRADAPGAFILGARHGAECVGCCWALMALLFVGGIMNLLWIAGLAALVLLEKVLQSGRLLTRAVGLILLGAGVWIVVDATV